MVLANGLARVAWVRLYGGSGAGRFAGRVFDVESDTDGPAMESIVALAGRAFSRVADASRSTANQARVVRNGEEAYPAWLDAIAHAEQSVHLENYILAEDGIGGKFAEALTGAAARGVRTRVIYDWLGCRGRTSGEFWARLRSAGVEVRCYNPPRLGSPLGWISRDHRKVLCVDGRLGFTGGLCIGDHWVGDPAKGVTAWRDTAIELHGPAVADLEAAFADSWKATGAPLADGELPIATDPEASGRLDAWVIAGRPGVMGLYRLEQLIAELAERRLWLADAYFVATTGYVHALCGAAQAGVDVRLLVPGSSNIGVVRSLSRAGYRPLLEAGVRVFEWNGPMMHAKTAVADSCWARIGSSNSNLASWISNRELDVVIEDEGFARTMEAMFEEDVLGATEILLESGTRRPSAVPDGGNAAPRSGLTANAGRLLAGTVGIGSTIGAELGQRRVIGPTENWIVAAAGAVILGLAILMLLAPLVIVIPVALLAAWIAAALFIRAWKLSFRRRAGAR